LIDGKMQDEDEIKSSIPAKKTIRNSPFLYAGFEIGDIDIFLAYLSKTGSNVVPPPEPT